MSARPERSRHAPKRLFFDQLQILNANQYPPTVRSSLYRAVAVKKERKTTTDVSEQRNQAQLSKVLLQAFLSALHDPELAKRGQKHTPQNELLEIASETAKRSGSSVILSGADRTAVCCSLSSSASSQNPSAPAEMLETVKQELDTPSPPAASARVLASPLPAPMNALSYFGHQPTAPESSAQPTQYPLAFAEAGRTLCVFPSFGVFVPASSLAPLAAFITPSFAEKHQLALPHTDAPLFVSCVPVSRSTRAYSQHCVKLEPFSECCGLPLSLPFPSDSHHEPALAHSLPFDPRTALHTHAFAQAYAHVHDAYAASRSHVEPELEISDSDSEAEASVSAASSASSPSPTITGITGEGGDAMLLQLHPLSLDDC